MRAKSLLMWLSNPNALYLSNVLSLKPAQPRPPVYRRGRATIPCPLSRFEHQIFDSLVWKDCRTLYENGEPISINSLGWKLTIKHFSFDLSLLCTSPFVLCRLIPTVATPSSRWPLYGILPRTSVRPSLQ